MTMSAAPRPTRSGYSTDWAADRPYKPQALRNRGSGSRYLITFCVGIAATLAWQSYGDAAREIVSERYPQLAWIAPAAPAASPDAASVPSITSGERQELKTISLDVAALRQRVDQLSANHDKVTRDITAQLEQSRQEILDKISAVSAQPTTPALRKPVPAAPSH
jgi:hypothetical protein